MLLSLALRTFHLVGCLWTESNRCFFWGPQNCTQYSRWGCSVEWDNNFPQTTNDAVLDAPQDTAGSFGYQGTAYSICHWPSSQVLFCRAARQTLPLICTYYHTDLSPVENPALDLVVQVVEVCELLPVGWTHSGEVHREASPLGGTTHWIRGRIPLCEQWQMQSRITWL